MLNATMGSHPGGDVPHCDGKQPQVGLAFVVISIPASLIAILLVA